MSAPFQRACAALTRAIENPYSAFYRDLYKKIPDFSVPQTLLEWRALPLLAREHIASVPLEKRVFIPWQQVRIIRATSGTSGRGVLCIPTGAARTFPDHMLAGATLFSFQYHIGAANTMDHIDGKKRRVLQADPTRMEASARLAAKSAVDALHGLPSQLLAFAPCLAQRYDLAHIRFIEISGEHLSSLQRAAIQTLYPRAVIRERFSVAEAQGAVATTPLGAEASHVLEVFSKYYVELIDANGLVIDEEGQTGELVITSLDEGEAFPLMRYRLGDTVTLIRKEEPVHLEILGRTDKDRVRLGIGEINLFELERAIAAVAPEAVDFEATVGEDLRDSVPLPQLSIILFTAGAEIDTEQCAKKLAGFLRINQKRSYADGVAKGLCLPLKCAVKNVAANHMKRKHLIDARA
ncbi:MAG: hypothetical protein AAB449_02815 [Patescibacteria group bacterium]